MRTIEYRPKPIAFFLTALLLFQSCVVYHKTPTNLFQASQETIKTKVVNANGEISKYKYIAFEDGQFYGVKKKSGELIKTPLNQQDLAKVLTKDKSVSTLLTIALLVSTGVVLIFGVVLAADVGVDL